jgi:hypothetical protein
MDQFKNPTIKYVSGGSKGIATKDRPISPTHNFMQSDTIPELIELQRRNTYNDSAEARLIKAYRDAGESEERLGEVLLQFRKSA